MSATRPQSGFLRTLVFGALSGLAFAPVVRALSFDVTLVSALYLTANVAAYAFLIGEGRSAPLAAATLTAGVGSVGALCFDSLLPTAILLTAILGYTRSRILLRDRLEHPLKVEVVIGGLALVAAELIVERSLSGIGISIWAYWLVQSAFFLVPSKKGARRAAADPFDAAVGRAADLMDNVR